MASIPRARARGQRKHKRCLRDLHVLVGDNVYTAPDGRRRCLPCYREYRRVWRLRRFTRDMGLAPTDLSALQLELSEAERCLCGGPHCGPNARTWYFSVYPGLRELLAPNPDPAGVSDVLAMESKKLHSWNATSTLQESRYGPSQKTSGASLYRRMLRTG